MKYLSLFVTFVNSQVHKVELKSSDLLPKSLFPKLSTSLCFNPSRQRLTVAIFQCQNLDFDAEEKNLPDTYVKVPK